MFVQADARLGRERMRQCDKEENPIRSVEPALRATCLEIRETARDNRPNSAPIEIWTQRYFL